MESKTFDALWSEYLPRRVQGKKTAGEVVRTYERYVQPKLGDKLVGSTKFKTIDKLHADMRETPYQANRVLSLLKTMYKYASALEWVERGFNPAKDVIAYPERKRRRHMKPGEAPRIAEAILNRERTAPDACLYLWLIIFTGARSGEIKAATWGDIEDGMIILRKHKSERKTGVDRIIALPPAAVEKLNKLKPAELRHPKKKIIEISAPQYIWRWIRVEAKCKDLRIHDLRHTFGSYALERGYSLDQIGEALAHTNPQTTKIYAELTNRSRKRIALDASLAILADMKVIDRADVITDPLS